MECCYKIIEKTFPYVGAVQEAFESSPYEDFKKIPKEYFRYCADLHARYLREAEEWDRAHEIKRNIVFQNISIAILIILSISLLIHVLIGTTSLLLWPKA